MYGEFAHAVAHRSAEHWRATLDTPARRPVAALDSHLDGRTYVALNTVTIADLALANNLKYCDQEMVRQFSELSRYFDELTSRPAYKRIEEQSEYPR